jgi:hypothetical protein
MAKTFPLTNQHANALLDLLRQVQEQKGDYLSALEDAIEMGIEWAEWTEEPERVIFRKFPHTGEVIALFPDQYNPRNGNIGSYLHNGQHAETAPDFGDTKAAEPGEYYNLQQELRRQGYGNLRIVKRFGKLGK